MRRLAIAACGSAALLVCLSANAYGASAPNPCTVLHPSKIAAAFDRPSAPASKLTAYHEAGRSFRKCTWGKGKVTLSVTTGPSFTLGSFGGPGIRTHPVEGLGARSWYSHDDSPQFQYADVFFMRPPFYGDIHINGNLPFADILALARALYRAE